MREEEEDRIKNVVAFRTLLKNNLENSKSLASSLDKTEQRLEGINKNLSSLEAAVRPVPRQKCTFSAIRDRVDHTIGPAAAVLKVYDAIKEIEKSLLSDPASDLSKYLMFVKQLEEALKFLTENCGLAIGWLEDVLQFLEDNAVAEDPYITNVRKSLSILKELQATESQARRKGGILFSALEKLEIEFKELLSENCIPVTLTFPSSEAGEQQAYISPPPIPVSVIQKLQAIIGRLNANNRLPNVLQIYVNLRSREATRSLQNLGLNYVDKSITEADDVQDLEDYIDQWCEHLELAVKHVFEVEYNLCNDVFAKVGLHIWMFCFSEIAIQSGIVSFLEFGKKVTACKKDPVKLLKLLDMFAVLDKLRVDVNRLFGGKACTEIQALTRNVIKSVVNGACEIFLELPHQVELQRRTSPPSDGSVPKLVTFVTDYCNQLLGNKYRPLLTKVLQIHQNWKQEKNNQVLLLTNQIYLVTKEIGLNLDAWTRTYKDVALSYVFMMNNHCHFCNIKGTEFGDVMGDSWWRAHEQFKDYYMALYVKETWGKILPLLSQEGQVFSSPDMAKRRLRAFNEAFEDLYQKQSNWVVCNEDLRLKICKMVVQGFVPAYRNFLHNYFLLVEQNGSPNKYVKYTVSGLEIMLSSLFEPWIRKFGSNKYTHLIGRIKNIVTDPFHVTLMAV